MNKPKCEKSFYFYFKLEDEEELGFRSFDYFTKHTEASLFHMFKLRVLNISKGDNSTRKYVIRLTLRLCKEIVIVLKAYSTLDIKHTASNQSI